MKTDSFFLMHMPWFMPILVLIASAAVIGAFMLGYYTDREERTAWVFLFTVKSGAVDFQHHRDGPNRNIPRVWINNRQASTFEMLNHLSLPSSEEPVTITIRSP